MKKPFIVCDFDGTISLQDVNDKIFQIFGDEHSYQIEADLQAGKINDREALLKQYQRVKMSKAEFENFIQTEILLDPYFKDFYQLVTKYKVKFAIVSGGFENYIQILLEQYQIGFTDLIYANRFDFRNGQIELTFFHDLTECDQTFGVCGNCKSQIISELKLEDYQIIYVGDGLTDRCVSAQADLLFARKDSSLEKYALANNFEYISFSSFKEIINVLFDDGIISIKS